MKNVDEKKELHLFLADFLLVKLSLPHLLCEHFRPHLNIHGHTAFSSFRVVYSDTWISNFRYTIFRRVGIGGWHRDWERERTSRGEGYQRWCLVDRRILRFKWAMFYWLYRKNHSVTLSSIFPSLFATFDKGSSFCFHITSPLHITYASQLLCAILRVERKHG